MQNIPPDQLLWEIAAIVDKFILKTNTLIVIGTSSAVKTRVINIPLVMLARFVGRISNSNASSAFAWMYCVNVPLVSIDEALMAPEAIQKFKNVACGDNTLIGVKHKASMTIAHTPLIFTAKQTTMGRGQRSGYRHSQQVILSPCFRVGPVGEWSLTNSCLVGRNTRMYTRNFAFRSFCNMSDNGNLENSLMK